MRIRPASLYRNLVYLAGIFLILYAGYCIVGYDDGAHISHPKNPKHLYITVDKNRIEHRFDKLAPKRIVAWTTIFGNKLENSHMLECPGLSDRCLLDSNRDLIRNADAVLFHAGDFDHKHLPDPAMRNASQRYVFMVMEAPAPMYNRTYPKNFFNWTMTHLYTSDVLFKYGGFWLTTKEAETRGFKVSDHYVNERTLRKSKAGIFGLISNCNTASKRELAIAELAKHIPVTIAGKCALKESDKELCPLGRPCELFSDYPFFFAVENSVCADYVTEKYWSRYEYPSIPIVMKRSVYRNVNLPHKSVIAMDDFANPKEMAEYLLSLERNATAYAEYFKWRKGGWTIAPWNAPGFRNGYCKLCEKLWEKDQSESTIEDVWKRFENESQCEGDAFTMQWIKG